MPGRVCAHRRGREDGERNYDRLVGLKSAFDPRNLFGAEGGIEAADGPIASA